MTIEECREYLPEGWIAPIQNDPVLWEIFEEHEYDLEQEAVPPFLIQELRGGNKEFLNAAEETLAALNAMDLPEVRYFLEQFAAGFGLTLDELT